MLEQAREQLKEYADQLVFENLDYGDPAWVNKMQAYGPFDAIVSGYSIHHQPDARKREIYAEIFSLLKPVAGLSTSSMSPRPQQLDTDLFNNHYRRRHVMPSNSAMAAPARVEEMAE